MRILCLVGLHRWLPSRRPDDNDGGTSSRHCGRCGKLQIKTGLDGWTTIR